MMRWRVEPHCHTNSSSCSTLAPDRLIAIAARKKIDALAVTNHNEIEHAFWVRERATFFTIVGEEITTSDGEVIGLFLRERIAPGRSAEETVAEIHDQGGIAFLPHPFDPFRRHAIRPEKREEIGRIVDAIEGWNARNLFASSNAEACRFAARLGKPVVSGSDAHLGIEVGRAGMRMAPFDGPAAFLRHLADAEQIRRKQPFWVHGVTKIRRMWVRYGHY